MGKKEFDALVVRTRSRESMRKKKYSELLRRNRDLPQFESTPRGEDVADMEQHDKLLHRVEKLSNELICKYSDKNVFQNLEEDPTEKNVLEGLRKLTPSEFSAATLTPLSTLVKLDTALLTSSNYHKKRKVLHIYTFI
ncbi:hypothetical protein Ciccas_007325 [Cichlidogyrus casuarinus]|uniref:Uncharacterized protein n=1 Tax=Cichlidogyrus casuarinus TaxID=1844966 RepID=A0ABD2Q5T3_9PLAT